MIIGGIQKSSLIDFPENVSAIIFTQGCNFRCKYCHNPELLNHCNTKFDFNDTMNFLKKRIGKLDGVVISGGEPTIQKNIIDDICKIKNLGYKVKLDTNGTNPDVLKDLIKNNLLDYVAMDIKAPLEKYSDIIGVNVDTDKIEYSIKLLLNGNIDYEFRTTVLKRFLKFSDFDKIGDLINNAKKYYLQKFVPTKVFNENLKNDINYSDDEFEIIAESLRKKIKYVGIR